MKTLITFQESNYTDSGYFYRCPGNHYDDFSGEYVPLAEYEALEADNAGEIAALEAERDGLRAALKPFADLWRDSLADKPDDTPTYGFTIYGFDDVVITVGQIREARKALGGS